MVIQTHEAAIKQMIISFHYEIIVVPLRSSKHLLFVCLLDIFVCLFFR